MDKPERQEQSQTEFQSCKNQMLRNEEKGKMEI
jgi:hypothetical protein